MSPVWRTLLIPLCAQVAAADFLGPRYPAPLDLSSDDSLVTAAWKNLTQAFDAHLNGSAPVKLLTGVQNLTFSFGAFSIHDPVTAESLQYHYTAPEIANSEAGVKSVDADSVYRVASVTKLFTVYAGMLDLTEEQWNTPLTQCLPGLAEFAAKRPGEVHPTQISQWEKITPFALASQLSGASADGPPFLPNDVYITYVTELLANSTTAVDPVTYGLPPVDVTDPLLSGICPGTNSSCTGALYVPGVQAMPPTFLPWSSPAYSNNGFTLLGIALANLTGKTIDNLYREAIFEPLDMTSTNSSPPVDLLNRSVVAGGDPTAAFLVDQGPSKSSGGIFTTLNDLAKFSTSILNSTLLPAEKTRRWMKPITHTASLNTSIGAPWEIHRYTHPAGSSSAGVVTDLYTKLGDSGAYGGVAVLIPEYGAGFNMIGASSLATRSGLQALVTDAVVRVILPALEAQAAAEAAASFAGTYTSTDPNLNSSLTLALDPEVRGLSISEWTSNGTDALAYQTELYLGTGGIRLLPTITEAGTDQYGFRATPYWNQTLADAAVSVGPITGFNGANAEWISVSASTYGGVAVDSFVFDVDGAGSATALSIPALKVKLERET